MVKQRRLQMLLALAEDVSALGTPSPEIDWTRRFLVVQSFAHAILGKARRPGMPPAGKRERETTGRAFVAKHGRWERCEVCYGDQNLTRHHCVPIALGGKGPSVTLCKHCHHVAHKLWGEGHVYTGPESARETLHGLREFISNNRSQQSAEHREMHRRRELIRAGIASLLAEEVQP